MALPDAEPDQPALRKPEALELEVAPDDAVEVLALSEPQRLHDELVDERRILAHPLPHSGCLPSITSSQGELCCPSTVPVGDRLHRARQRERTGRQPAPEPRAEAGSHGRGDEHERRDDRRRGQRVRESAVR